MTSLLSYYKKPFYDDKVRNKAFRRTCNSIINEEVMGCSF
jgi:hypothetical protein